VDEDIIGKVAKEGVPCLVRGNNGDGSLLAIPLKIRSQIFGVLVSRTWNGQSRSAEKALYFLNILAEKASFSIENLALYENIYENLFSTLYAFVETIEAKDPYTKQHSTRVSNYGLTIARAMGCARDEEDILDIAGNLHDIGKIGIPDSILLKQGGLTDEEFEVIKRHPVIGSNIIGHFGMWTVEQEIIRHHHERWDGKGYPDNLKGEDIPFLSRIMSVADAYDAMTSDRSYRKKMEEEKVVNIIRENSGGQFDPDVVDTFLQIHGNGWERLS
jgi:HD-GYP domain-containing protein (c-di-GMP phosphodiesterase class II)